MVLALAESETTIDSDADDDEEEADEDEDEASDVAASVKTFDADEALKAVESLAAIAAAALGRRN